MRGGILNLDKKVQNIHQRRDSTSESAVGECWKQLAQIQVEISWRREEEVIARVREWGTKRKKVYGEMSAPLLHARNNDGRNPTTASNLSVPSKGEVEHQEI